MKRWWVMMWMGVWMIAGLSGTSYGQTAAELTRKLEQLKAYPDLIVVNGKISTMDASNREVQAMAVKNNRILALGTEGEIRSLAGPKTEVRDAKGRRVLPGLIDGHTHPNVFSIEHWFGIEGEATSKRYNDPQLKIVYATGNDATEVLRSLESLVRQRAQELGPGKWIWVTLFGGKNIVESRGIVFPLFLQRGGQAGPLTPQFLDTLAPNNPLIVFVSEAIGPEVHNTKAKEKMQQVVESDLQGLSARTGVAFNILLRGRIEEIADILKREILTCLSPQGVTTYGNHYYGVPNTMKAHHILYERGELPARYGWWLGTLWGDSSQETENLKFLYRNLGDFRGIGNDYIWNAGVSNEGWETGLFCTKATRPEASQGEGPTMAMTIMSGVFSNCDTAKIDYDKQAGYQQVKSALESGLRIGFMHGYSDGTYDALIHMVEEAVSQGKLTLEQVRALRISTEHNPMVRPDQVQKMAKYNMMPAFNGYQVQGNIKGGAFLKVYGEQYMTWMAPMKSLVNAGAHPVFNTDAHLYPDPPYATPMEWPPQWNGNIWAFIEFFVTRKMPNDGITYNRNEAMDRVSMMRAATIWGAEQLLNEKNIGSLEVGKLADFIVLDKDFFTIPEDQIHTIKTLLTAVGGKVVYQAANY